MAGTALISETTAATSSVTHESAFSCAAEVVSDASRFLALATEWNEAVDRAGVPHPFARHEWLRTWWECFGGEGQLHIVVVRNQGRIAAIAPLLLETTRMYGLTVRRLRLLQNDHTPRADFIVTGKGDEAYRAIWRSLWERRDEWDVVQLNQLPEGSMTRTIIPALAGDDGCLTGFWRSGDAPYLELRGSWDEYVGTLTPKFRQNLRNRQTRLARLGEPALEELREGAPLLDALEDSFRLEASGWKEQEGSSINSDPAVHRFYRLLAERAASDGWMSLLFVTVNGRRIATSYGARFANRLFLFKTGYDPAYAQCSPFKLLTFFAVQRAYGDGLAEVDFLGDSEAWKLEWTQTTRRHDWLFVFADRSRGRLLHRAKFQVAPALKRWQG
jgi:CelD/BcsL family acetyltransferase involved in cellulose biosynthesis